MTSQTSQYISRNLDAARNVLHDIWGYDDFRDGQAVIISAILDGEDVMAIMPTGSGKSLCYQVPALVLGGLTLVVSPLISLMHDQVDKLRDLGIAAAYIDSTLEYPEIVARVESAKLGALKILYLSPERLQSDLMLIAAESLNVSLLAIDEAHCISKWGVDFRPEYRQIPDFVNRLAIRPIMAAFTATAAADTRRDIASSLGLVKPETIVTGFERPNLIITVERATSKPKREAAAVKFVRERKGQCGIVYCLTRAAVNDFAQELRTNGINCRSYHAGYSTEERNEAQEAFLSGEVDVIVATSAFGMGIDKPDVRYVLSLGMRDNVEDYYQNIGRAGRDGKPADCHLIWCESDISFWKWLFEKSLDDADLYGADYDREMSRRLSELEKMRSYCRTMKCRRQFILDHFGEYRRVKCGTCDNCRHDAAGGRKYRNSPQQNRYYDPLNGRQLHYTKSGKARKRYSERKFDD